MNKTVNVNIGGYPFILNDDAYQLLDSYLTSLSDVLRHQKCDAAEVISDIEARTAEILLATQKRGTIITAPMIERIIEQMGEARDLEDFEEIDVTADRNGEHIRVTESELPPPPPIEPEPIRKRLYRSEDDRMLGGVCGGLAAYFDIDPTWLRLGVVLLTLLSASTVAVVYVVLWIVLPVAVTPYQKMQMRGTSPTLDNIGRTVAGSFQSVRESLRNPAGSLPSEATSRNGGSRRVANGVVTFFSALAKVLIVMIAVVALPVIVAILIAAASVVVLLCGLPFGIGGAAGVALSSVPHPGLALTTAFFALLVVGLPLLMLVMTLISSATDREITTPAFRKTITVTWGIALGLTVILGTIFAILN